MHNEKVNTNYIFPRFHLEYSVRNEDSLSKDLFESRLEFSNETVQTSSVNRVLRPRCNKISDSIKPILPPILQPQLPLQKRSVIEMKRSENVVNGQVVLVKWPSYPYWPAHITNVNGTSVHVMFFGDDRLAAF